MFDNTLFARDRALKIDASGTHMGLSLVHALETFTGANLSLSIANNNISVVPVGTFTAQSLRTSLTAVDLSDNMLTVVDESVFA